MTIAIRPDLKSNTFGISRTYTPLREKETRLVDFKSYQKLFVLLISFSIILIFPDSPRELENICENYNSRKICNVW